MKSEVMKTPMTEGEYRSPKTKVIEVEFQRSILSGSNPGAGENEEGGEAGGQGF